MDGIHHTQVDSYCKPNNQDHDIENRIPQNGPDFTLLSDEPLWSLDREIELWEHASVAFVAKKLFNAPTNLGNNLGY